MWIYALVICTGCMGTFSFAQWVFEDDGCRTPDRGTGNCIPLLQCQPMVQVLQTLQRPISNSVLKRLQAYRCGLDGDSVKVCCPSGPIILEHQNAPHFQEGGHPNMYLLPKDCGYFNSDNRIVNGENAYLNEFPWMALISYRTRKGIGFNCGGTIINKNYILTAAHCITGLGNSELVSVRVGEHDLKSEMDCEKVNRTFKCNPPVQNLRIEEVVPHPRFGTGSFSNDVGLLRVSTINLNVENARPVCLPLEKTKRLDWAIVTGWGVTNTFTGETSTVLQKVKLPIADKERCAETYRNHNIRLGDTQICAGGANNKDSCPGDSGGPMMVPIINEDGASVYVQHGIVSFGPKYCGIPGYPGVYTSVGHYLEWILDNLKP